jgi:hypothetical protein
VIPEDETAEMTGGVISEITPIVVKVAMFEMAEMFPDESTEVIPTLYAVLGRRPARMYVCDVPGVVGVGSPVTAVAVPQVVALSVPVVYLMSYEETALPDGRSDGAVKVRVAEFSIIPDAERVEMVFGGVVSGAETVVNVLSRETARLPDASLDFTR